MPAVPKKVEPLILEFELLEHEMPEGLSRARLDALALQIDDLEVSKTKCVFVPMPPVGMNKETLAKRIGSMLGSAKRRNKSRHFQRRWIKRGAVEGIGIWRRE